ncbi:pitrilysin family protein [Stenotrophomonas sp. MMGLT7]|uniref:M16 family metallopeptidase n=1 Tax=Stenotrophomonas sp. MMGLT7 TaxID=2901227 RepID=UPI001E2C92DF|nr:pitrilysin family protein [Stenotrophomonas sp. MMGLT7]MCD7098226.1 insulinase family protein [Stenotrophomonas sp. MMGLT7]
MRPRSILLALCLALPASQGALAAAQPGAVLPPGISAGPSVEGISEYRLDNGLRVLLFPDQGTPTTTVNVTYSVGAAHENYGETGMAHLLEHLLFKGTPTVPNIAAEFKKRGIVFNGTTGQDRTNYYGSFPANEQTLDWLLRAEADRMVNSFVARKDLDSEMTVVRNEMEIGENSPARVLSQRLRAQAYLWHAYGDNVIGNRSDVENVPIERLQAFYRTWYQPDTATVIVAGRFDPQRVLQVVHDSFGAVPRPARTLPPRYTVEPAQDGEREINIRRVGETPLVGLAYHAPAFTHPDSPAFEVLDSIMGSEPSGRLYKALVETKLSPSIDNGADAFRDPGLATFYASTPPGGDPAQVEKALLELVEGLDRHPFTDEEVADAKRRLGNRYLRANNNVNGVGHLLSEYIAAGDWRLWFLRRDRMEQVSAEDVNRVARTYLKPSNRTLARFIPTPKPDSVEIAPAPTVASLLEGYSGRPPEASGERFDASLESIKARTEYRTLGDGLKVALLRKQTRGELVSMVFMSHFGDDASTQGLDDAASFTGMMLMRGSRTMSREQIAKRFDELGARISVTGGGRFASITLTAKRENFIPALRLAAEVLRTPTFPEAEFELLRSQRIAGLEKEDRSPGQVADEAMRKHFDPWPPGHPEAFRSREQILAGVKAVKLEDVRAFHRRFYGTADAEAAVVGDFDPAQIERELQTLFTGWKSPYPFKRTSRPFFQPDQVVRQTFETPDKANAVVVTRGNFPLNASDPDHPALLVASRIFGSGAMSSRLGTRVRGQEGLSYYVGSGVIVDNQDDNSVFYMQATSAPENMPKVETAMREELQRFVRDGVTEQELEDTKASLLTMYEDSRSSDRGLAGMMRMDLYFDRTLQWSIDFENAIRNLTLEQVNAAIRRRIKPDAVSTFVAGDFAGVERKAAAAKSVAAGR